MQTVLDPIVGGLARRVSPAEGDYRVKMFKAASRSARDEVDRANAALAETWAAERRRSRESREAEVRGSDASRGAGYSPAARDGVRT
jgi:hypothetical protein